MGGGNEDYIVNMEGFYMGRVVELRMYKAIFEGNGKDEKNRRRKYSRMTFIYLKNTPFMSIILFGEKKKRCEGRMRGFESGNESQVLMCFGAGWGKFFLFLSVGGQT